MTTIEEIESEIAALKEAYNIVEERTGDKFNNDGLKWVMRMSIENLERKLEACIMDLPVEYYAPEFDKYEKYDSLMGLGNSNEQLEKM